MISDNDIQKVLDRADLIDVVKQYVPNLQVKGNKAVCCCPFHSERTGSFHIDNNKGLWYCFGCHVGGNVFQFVEKIDNCDFRTAVLTTAKLCNVKVEDTKEQMTAEQREATIKREAMLDINSAVSNYYISLLWEDTPSAQEARDYIKKRKWSLDYARQIGMGYAPDKNVLYRLGQEKMMNIDLMVEMGLLKRTDEGKIYDAYRDRLIIPIKSRSNQIIGFTARILNEDKYKRLKETGKAKTVPPKYINSKECEIYKKKESIFGIETAVNQGVKDGVFYLVEGAPDVMRLHSIGVCNAIASLGGAWTENQLNQLKKYNAKLCFIPDCDPPQAG